MGIFAKLKQKKNQERAIATSEKYVIELTVLDKDNIVKYIPTIKKYFDFSIGEIRRNALEKRPIITCHYTKEPEDLIKLSSLLKELKVKGANLKIVENLENTIIDEISINIIDNLIQRRKEIDREADEMWDLGIENE